MKNEFEKYNVSRETIEQLKAYEASLREWQNKFNLVSKSSLDDAWKRHFLDSLQLLKYIPEGAKSLCDFGSGAGFPGMVLAIALKEKTPYLKAVLVESIGKKTLYLKEVAKITNTNVNIINDRIENLPNVKYDIITSRAMTSLSKLLGFAHRFCKKNTICIFPKGKSYMEEISEAKNNWNFDCLVENSEQSDEGKILIIKNITRKQGAK